MRLVVGGALLLNIGTVIGCGFFYLDIFTCPNPDHEHVDAMGKRDPCHERDPDAGTDAGEDAAEADVANAGCTGEWECVPPGTTPWVTIPWLTWIGPKGQAPPCPERAPVSDNTSYTGLVIPELSCDGCTCAPSTGSCQIPWGFTAHAALLCSAGGTQTPFDALSAWDGSCDKENPIAAGAMCGMPGVSCVQSISIDPLTIKTESCVVDTIPTSEKAYFEIEVISCVTRDDGDCDNGSYQCVTAADAFPGGFRQCIHAPGVVVDKPCPKGYPNGPLVIHEAMTDTRECSCTCGEPAGSKCTAFASVYEDSACSQSIFTDYMISSTDPNACVNVPAGVGIESKKITNIAYKPGTCEPKGEKVGAVTTGGLTHTLCCVAERVIP